MGAGVPICTFAHANARPEDSRAAILSTRGAMKIAVIAHRNKSLGGGLPALRAGLARRGHPHVGWFEVSRSKKVPAVMKAALADHPDVLVVWGGDGMVQRAVDALVRSGQTADTALAVIPAGTANLFATNLGVPIDLDGALDVALGGACLPIDVGTLNGERFVVMAGAGFDALMIHDASGGLKHRFGRAAYVWTGSKNLSRASSRVTIEIDGRSWFKGRASSVIFGNVGTLIGGLELFAGADPTDGRLEVAVVRAEKMTEWARLAARALFGKIEHSPLLSTSSGQKVDVWLERKLPYELDGGARPKAKRLKARIEPHAVRVCVPPTNHAVAHQNGALAHETDQ